jgi:hypothetical protein
MRSWRSRGESAVDQKAWQHTLWIRRKLEMELNENELVQKSIAYLKRQYDEDTVRMDIRKNDVVNGSGVLEVDCTVSINGDHSDWTKWFSFKNGAVTGMRWALR